MDGWEAASLGDAREGWPRSYPSLGRVTKLTKVLRATTDRMGATTGHTTRPLWCVVWPRRGKCHTAGTSIWSRAFSQLICRVATTMLDGRRCREKESAKLVSIPPRPPFWPLLPPIFSPFFSATKPLPENLCITTPAQALIRLCPQASTRYVPRYLLGSAGPDLGWDSSDRQSDLLNRSPSCKNADDPPSAIQCAMERRYPVVSEVALRVASVFVAPPCFVGTRLDLRAASE